MGKYLYVKAQFEGSERSYSYICEDVSVKVGDKVKVPVGVENRPKTATITELAWHTVTDAPYPPDKCKRVIEIMKESDNT